MLCLKVLKAIISHFMFIFIKTILKNALKIANYIELICYEVLWKGEIEKEL